MFPCSIKAISNKKLRKQGFFRKCGLKKDRFVLKEAIYLLLVYLVTAFVPSLTACLANSPGNKSRTAVWISRDEMVDFCFEVISEMLPMQFFQKCRSQMNS